MCQFLEAQSWRQETSAAVDRLQGASAEALQALELSAKVQGELAKAQAEAAEQHRRAVENGTQLAGALEASRVNVKEIIDEVRGRSSLMEIRPTFNNDG